MNELKKGQIEAVILGHALGDALGVPVEFFRRPRLKERPVTKMLGYGTYDVPAGAWSDDTSMTLGLLESLARLGRVDARDIMENFAKWVNEAAFTPTGKLFDIGRTTLQAIMKYLHGEQPELCGGRSSYDNGNGSLMRVAPLALLHYARHGKQLTADDFAEMHTVSALTHGHARSKVACGLYDCVMGELLAGGEVFAAVQNGLARGREFYAAQENFAPELAFYERLFDLAAFRALPEDEIKSSGYVVDTLEAALWCLLQTESYADCVLMAVNLGEDTDTVAAIAGGLAAAHYGLSAIPAAWRETLLRADFIEGLCENFAQSLEGAGQNTTSEEA